MEQEIEKIEIPDEPKVKPEDNAKSLSELMKLSITEEKLMVPMDKFKYMAHLYTNSGFHIIRKIEDFQEIINNQWQFVPFDIPEDQQKAFGRYTQCLHFFCIDDAKSLKKFTKTIKKYFPFSTVDWQPFDEKEYKSIIKK